MVGLRDRGPTGGRADETHHSNKPSIITRHVIMTSLADLSRLLVIDHIVCFTHCGAGDRTQDLVHSKHAYCTIEPQPSPLSSQ